MEHNYCCDCKYEGNCRIAHCINFCEDCEDYPSCGICYETCRAGHEIECNNGFELKDDYFFFEIMEDD